MAREIPQVVRAAAGLAATVLDEARKLPETLPGLPVRMIGLAMQKAMWLQQQYSGLVARGDELLTGIRGENEPGLATFDDELPAEEATGFRGSAFDRAEDVVEEDLLAGPDEDQAADTTVIVVEELVDDGDDALEELAIEELVDDEAAGLLQDPAPEEVVAAVQEIAAQVAAAEAAVLQDTAATEDADGDIDVLTPDGEVATVDGTVTDEGVAAVEPTDEGGAPDAEVTGGDAAVEEAPAAAETTGAPPAPPVAGYDDWSIAQLRGRLRGYAQQTVEQLLAYEEATLARDPYLRMLRNRLERLQSESA